VTFSATSRQFARIVEHERKRHKCSERDQHQHNDQMRRLVRRGLCTTDHLVNNTLNYNHTLNHTQQDTHHSTEAAQVRAHTSVDQQQIFLVQSAAPLQARLRNVRVAVVYSLHRLRSRRRPSSAPSAQHGKGGQGGKGGGGGGGLSQYSLQVSRLAGTTCSVWPLNKDVMSALPF